MGSERHAGGDWPYTTRLLPWLIATFLVMLWLLPFDSTSLNVNAPVKLTLDRLLIGFMLIVWVATSLVGGRAAPRVKTRGVHVALLVFVTTCVISEVNNLHALQNLGELQDGVKKLAVVFGYLALLYVVTSVLRPSEVENYTKFVLALAVLAAIGTIWQYRTGSNLFYEWSRSLLPHGLFTVAPEATNPQFERAAITGPATHGLALTSMFAMAFPFAMVALFRLGKEDKGKRFLYGLATVLILAGAISTVRKSAGIVPVVAMIPLMAYRPRQMIRLVPLGLILIVAIHLLAPGAMGTIKNQLTGGVFSSVSSQGRTADYEATRPDILTHTLVGRGFGTYDPHKYRILDNQYLGLLIEVGVVGVAAYLWTILAVYRTAHTAIRRAPPRRALTALGAAAATAAFAVSGALYDLLGFQQGPYLFLFIAGLILVMTGAPGERGGSGEPDSRGGRGPADPAPPGGFTSGPDVPLDRDFASHPVAPPEGVGQPVVAMAREPQSLELPNVAAARFARESGSTRFGLP